jgi:hypothetical protein
VTIISALLTVNADGTLSGPAPDGVPPGRHLIAITLAGDGTSRAGKAFTMAGFPIDDGPWDDRVSLRREDMYGPDGR